MSLGISRFHHHFVIPVGMQGWPFGSHINVTRWRTKLCLGILLWVAHLASGAALAAPFDHAHPLWDATVKQHVRAAGVDYSALKRESGSLDAYLNEVSSVARGEFNGWSEPDRIAFLSNAYNAYTVRLILDHYPLKSIKDIGSLLKGPWEQPVVRLFGESRTLDDLEHKILRADYSEPRIHFALVCAAKGCPPLRAEAYVGARLESQLNDQARAFLADSSKNRVEVASKTVYLSPIFKWYGGDFEKKSGTVLAALNPYWPDKATSTGGFKIRYTDYDWSLNDQGK
jgi:hypothetical protein